MRETGTISLKYISDMNPKLSDGLFQILKKLVAAEWSTRLEIRNNAGIVFSIFICSVKKRFEGNMQYWFF